MSLPERVNMIICITYDPAELKQSLIAMNPEMEISDQDVMDLIEQWADEDSRGMEYILQDENGDVL
jgi:hypothetical protein